MLQARAGVGAFTHIARLEQDLPQLEIQQLLAADHPNESEQPPPQVVLRVRCHRLLPLELLRRGVWRAERAHRLGWACRLVAARCLHLGIGLAGLLLCERHILLLQMELPRQLKHEARLEVCAGELEHLHRLRWQHSHGGDG